MLKTIGFFVVSIDQLLLFPPSPLYPAPKTKNCCFSLLFFRMDFFGHNDERLYTIELLLYPRVPSSDCSAFSFHFLTKPFSSLLFLFSRSSTHISSLKFTAGGKFELSPVWGAVVFGWTDDRVARLGPLYVLQDVKTRLFSASTRACKKEQLLFSSYSQLSKLTPFCYD